jgi:hypothetical protein
MFRPLLTHLWITIVLLLAGCASIGRPTVTQLTTDPAVFLVVFPLTFSADGAPQQFSVPPGFVTDLASIPRGLWWWQAPHEDTMAPAIVHDFLYWEQPCTKDEADAVIYVAMKQIGMKDGSIAAVYTGVRTPLGQEAWDKNKVARARGEARFFTSAFSLELANGNLDSKATLASIQDDAAKKNGAVAPSVPLATVRAVCQAAAKEFESLRAM